MISENDRELLRPVIGHRYTKEVSKILIEKNIKTSSGDDYSPEFITHVFNGRHENQGIEMAFFELFDRKNEIVNQTNALREKFLSTKKPEASTSGSN